jgi:hypothetical protein
LGDVAVAVAVELRQVGGCFAELRLADGAIAIDIEGSEEWVAAAETAEAAATAEASPFFALTFAAATEATARGAFAALATFATLTAGGVFFFAEFGAGVASAGGLGEGRRGCQQAKCEGPTCFGHDLVLS